MSEEPRHDEVKRLDITAVTSYLENKISQQQYLLQRYKGQNVRPIGLNLEAVRTEVARVEKLREAAARREYRGVATELAQDVTKAEQNIQFQKERLQQGFEDDNKFWELQTEIGQGQNALNEVSSEPTKAWVQKRIDELRLEQEVTARRRVLKEIEQQTANKEHIQNLQQVVAPLAGGKTE